MSAKATSPGTTKKRSPLRPDPGKVWEIPGFGPVVQDPLTFFEKGDLFALGADTITKALDSGMDVQALMASFDVPDDVRTKLRDGDIDSGLLANWQIAGRDLLKLAPMFPEALMDLYVLALSIEPDREAAARVALRGIDDDTGFGILETFVAQNGSTLADFFKRWSGQFQEAWGRSQANGSTPTLTG